VTYTGSKKLQKESRQHFPHPNVPLSNKDLLERLSTDYERYFIKIVEEPSPGTSRPYGAFQTLQIMIIFECSFSMTHHK
jgi:hypothetical protein